ncbi:MAG: DUF1559 domain-containing protein [Planctomycetes bacterium]|nr:DUF1559 domain-containing protein [Planctomycetota bacterium]
MHRVRASKARHAFTIVELLVAAGTAVLLLALTVPAIGQARQRAQLLSCENNLKFIGLALYNYHETHGPMPPGWVADKTDPQAGSWRGWQVSILPQMDNAQLSQRIDFDAPLPAAGAATAGGLTFQEPLGVYRCPSDPTPDVNALRSNYGTSNYSGNFGSSPIPRWHSGRTTTFWPGQVPTPTKSDGVFWWSSSTRMREMVDGPSNTFLVGERSVSSAAGIWPGVLRNSTENDQVTDCSYSSPLGGGLTSFSSRHQGGANFLMGDGRVVFISEHVESLPAPELGVYQKLANREDGMPIGIDF